MLILTREQPRGTCIKICYGSESICRTALICSRGQCDSLGVILLYWETWRLSKPSGLMELNQSKLESFLTMPEQNKTASHSTRWHESHPQKRNLLQEQPRYDCGLYQAEAYATSLELVLCHALTRTKHSSAKDQISWQKVSWQRWFQKIYFAELPSKLTFQSYSCGPNPSQPKRILPLLQFLHRL